MKALASPVRQDRHDRYPVLPKLTMGRTRTRSRNDSGCDVGWETPDWTSSLLEDTVQTWMTRLEGVVRQEVERVREVTEYTKGELKAANEDEQRREEALGDWKRHVLEMMELLTDLVECVNNDTKELICDTVGRCSSGHATLDEIEEDETEIKKNEELMNLFLLSTMDEKKTQKTSRKRKRAQPKMTMMKEFVNMYKKNGKMFKKSRKAGKSVQEAWTKLKKEEVIAKRRDSRDKRFSTSDFFEDAMYGMKMFQSIMDPEEIFEEWNWNFEEMSCCEDFFDDWRWNLEAEVKYEDIFQDWKWNMDIKEELKTNFYDTLGVHDDWNDFKFWSFVERSMAEVPDADDIIGVTPTLKIQTDDWKNWHYWDNWGSNQEILKALEETADADLESESNFWEQSEANSSIMNALIQDIDTGNLADTEDEDVRKTDAWEEWLFWDKTGTNEDILKELIEFTDMCDDGLDVYDDVLGFWDENEKNRDIIEDLVDADEQWENWDFWNDFGQTDDILKAYEEVINANRPKSPMTLTNLCLKKVSPDRVSHSPNKNPYEPYIVKSRKRLKPQQDINTIFWQIHMENEGYLGGHRRLLEEIHNLPVWDSPDVFNDYSELFDSRVKHFNPNQKPKDPVNIFKSWRSIFDEPVEEKVKDKRECEDNTYLLDDMEDVYGDWASVTLSDGRSEKKRQARGMKKDKNPQGLNQTLDRKKSAKTEEVRRKNARPGTPTITTVAIKPSCMEIFEYKYVHNQTCMKTPKKEKKTVHVWKNARSQKRLQAKLFAKQPRSRM